MKLLKYEGFILEDGPHGYKSKIRGDYKHFVTVKSWKKYIEQIIGQKGIEFAVNQLHTNLQNHGTES